jgi:hypothetical protein
VGKESPSSLHKAQIVPFWLVSRSSYDADNHHYDWWLPTTARKSVYNSIKVDWIVLCGAHSLLLAVFRILPDCTVNSLRQVMFHVSFAALAIIVIATSSVATDPVGSKNRILWVDCASNVPQPLQGTALPSVLPSALHCGRLEVPMDYKKPIAANNTISLGFSMYRPDKPLGLVNL